MLKLDFEPTQQRSTKNFEKSNKSVVAVLPQKISGYYAVSIHGFIGIIRLIDFSVHYMVQWSFFSVEVSSFHLGTSF